MLDDPLETASNDLGAARARIVAARERLRRLHEAEGGDLGPIRLAISRLDRMAAEVARIEREVAGPSVAAEQSR